MKKILLPGILALAVLLIAGYGMHRSMNSYGDLSDMALKNVLALADGEDPEDPNPGEDDGGDENKYDYTELNEDCTVFVGGAYAKGKKIICWSGSTHPECADCKL